MSMTPDRQTIDAEQRTYFNLLAEMGHTKHIGGMAATERLMDLISPKASDNVLDVGCGVGIGAVYLAEQFNCRVVGVDITPRMVERAQERAERHGQVDRVAYRVADMHALPFADACFSSAIAESVLSFSADKNHAVKELIRVVKPGGMIAFTEAIWVQPPPEGKADFMARAGGMPQGILTHNEWLAIITASDLEQIVAESYHLTAREESKNQYNRIHLSDYLRALSGFFRAITMPSYRQVFRSAMASVPKDYFKHIGYGIYGGRKR